MILGQQRPVIPKDPVVFFKEFQKPKTKTLDYSTVEDRLRTFANWPNKEIAPEKLANAGFIFTGIGDIVSCPFCGAEGHKWQKDDEPMNDHKAWKPHCSFLNAQIVEHDQIPPNLGEDTCGKFGITKPTTRNKEDVDIEQVAKLECLGATKMRPPQFAQYALKVRRLSSFRDKWPESKKQKPEELADAGFFYTGKADEVMCFYCGGGLKDWEDDDVVWEQHAFWFSQCSYLINKMGQEYVDEVQRKRRNLESSASETQVSAASSTSTSSTQTKEQSSSSSSSSNSEVPTNHVDCREHQSGESDNPEKLCNVCLVNGIEILFMPCRHAVCCVECAFSMAANRNPPTCPLCRKNIDATVKFANQL